MAHPGEIAASAIVFAVAIVAAVLAIVAWRAQRRAGSQRLVLVAVAFSLFVAKGLIVGVALLVEFVQHEHLEVVSAVFDLAIVGLLAWSILR